MMRAPIPATILVLTKELENPPTAAEVVEVELAADEVLVVDPLISWFTTETTTLEELAQEAPERILALLLKVMSAHCYHQQPVVVVQNPCQQSSQTGYLLIGWRCTRRTYIVESTAGLSKSHNLDTRVLAIQRTRPRRKEEMWETESAVPRLIKGLWS